MKMFCLIILTLYFFRAVSQNDSGMASGENLEYRAKTSIHEIEYQFPYMLGYSYFHNFGNKIVPGIGVRYGFGTVFTIGGAGSDFFSFDIKMRNLFAKNNKLGKTSYDLGFNYALISMQDDGRFYGLKASVLFTVYKPIRIGLSMRAGLTKWGTGGGKNSLTDYGILYFYPNISFIF